jgi:RimK-like ATPgrasp N-terminal domain
MNDRWGEPPSDLSRNGSGDLPSCVPLARHAADAVSEHSLPDQPAPKKLNHRGISKRETPVTRDALFTVWRDDAFHIVSENYFYKTEPYYSILRHELEGRPVRPSSSSVLDAYVVPVCLERAHLAGIPVCAWGISQGYAPLPSIVYGLNYFATTSDHSIIDDNEKAKEIIKHITNKGKYPFCYQKLDDGAEIGSCRAIFGKTAGIGDRSSDLAQRVYDLFAIPLVTITFVKYGSRVLLSSLSPTKYSQLSGEERTLLSAYLSNQEFL